MGCSRHSRKEAALMIDKVNFFGRNRRRDRADRGRLPRILVLSMLTLVPACAFQPPAALPPPGPFLTQLQRLPVAPITESNEDTIFEETGTMAIYQGFACAESREKGRQEVLHVQQAHDIPREMNHATVILSGWHFRYLNGDHNVLGLGTAIFGVVEGDKKISWEAAGVISDDDFGDPYRWCYHYTLIAWNTAAFAAR